MRAEDAYQIPYECGHLIESHAPEAVCPKCNRKVAVENWGKT